MGRYRRGGGSGFQRHLHGNWKLFWSSRENAGLKTDWKIIGTKVKVIQGGDLERRDKG